MEPEKYATAYEPLDFKKSKREVKIAQTVETAEYSISQTDAKNILAGHVRMKLNLDSSHEVNITLLDPDRTADLCKVEITKIVKVGA